MLRATASKVVRQGALNARRGVPLTAPRVQEFHASYRREEEAAKAEVAVPEAKEGWFTPLYGVAIGITLAVPAIHYEWYLVNEETQLMACFICFSGVIYKQFGGVIQEALEADGEQVLAQTNAAEDMMISDLKTTIEEIEAQEGITEDMEAVRELKIETYKELNETGKIKPLYNFKSQVEKLLSVIAAEEAVGQDKEKMSLLQEATEAVKGEFATSKDMQKKSLANAVAMLKGTKTGSDPVKEAYLAFFANKKKAAKAINVEDEIKSSRESLVSKLNAIAKNDKFYFEFDGSGKPKMVV